MSVSLLLVFVLAKASTLWGHAAVNGLGLVAYVWQDVIVALAFAAFEMGLRRIGATHRIAGAIYWTLVIYAAINIPVERGVFTPLTWPMLRATRGPLADSIMLYVTATNIALVLWVLAMAASLPLLIRYVPRQWVRLAAVGAIPVVLVGPIASSRVDTHGMDRNAVTALFGIGLPRVSANIGARDWRESAFKTGSAEDLSRFGATARGFNVIMVSLESTAAQYLSLYGGEHDAMPNLSALARQALVFENAYAVYPESIKGLYSVLCSTFPSFDSRPEEYENLECRSMAEVLADAGYRTALFHSGRFGYLGMESIIHQRGYQTLEDAASIGGNQNSSFGVDEPATVARMLNWIDTLPRGQNFFLTYLPIAGHHPYASPAGGPFTGTDEIDQYRNALHYGDASLGALIEGLRARGLEKNTVWVVYGDHGEAFGQHEGNYGHTFFLYDENIHVPFVIAAPGVMNRQERVRKVVSLVDVAPSLLDLVGIPSPVAYQGRTILDGAQRMALFLADYSLGILGLRDGPWKFMYETESGRTKLFNLEQDPREISDLSTRDAARVSWYSDVVRDWSSAQKKYISQGAVRSAAVRHR